MIERQRAPVVPRVFTRGDVSIPINTAVDEILSKHGHIAIGIVGPPCSGKSTALRHLAAHLADRCGIAFVDTQTLSWSREWKTCDVVIFTCHDPGYLRAAIPLATIRLAPWTEDDLIEYVLQRHRPQIDSVMRRVLADPMRSALAGCPGLWVRTLDELANQPDLRDVVEGLKSSIQRELSRDDWNQVGDAAIMTPDGEDGADAGLSWPLQLRSGCQRRAWLVRLFRVRCAAARWIQRLDEQWDPVLLECPTGHDVIELVATGVRDRALAKTHLLAEASSGNSRVQPTAVSLLAALDPAWQPAFERPVNLSRAACRRVKWPGCQLELACLSSADLSSADLSNAKLDRAEIYRVNFRHADLHGASLRMSSGAEPDFTGANLSSGDFRDISWTCASLEGATLDGANLQSASLCGSKLNGAHLRNANLRLARLAECDLTGADFSHADLSQADLHELSLRTALFEGADFSFANLTSCDCASMALPGGRFRLAHLTNVDFTASFIPGGCFERADLRSAKLAEIEWERADLRGADLRGATFHMGSSRSGLVFSPFASEGSRTGFYTDELHEQDFKPPEEIRKANLRGADLRHAEIDGVDFYLVDLRDAQYTSSQERILRSTGAILEYRVR
jgi:uncharacterized protein YjbI with pentapeptide repeats